MQVINNTHTDTPSLFLAPTHGPALHRPGFGRTYKRGVPRTRDPSPVYSATPKRWLTRTSEELAVGFSSFSREKHRVMLFPRHSNSNNKKLSGHEDILQNFATQT